MLSSCTGYILPLFPCCKLLSSLALRERTPNWQYKYSPQTQLLVFTCGVVIEISQAVSMRYQAVSFMTAGVEEQSKTDLLAPEQNSQLQS